MQATSSARERRAQALMAKGIRSQSSGSQVLAASFPAAQAGIATVSCHLPISQTSKELKEASDCAVMLDLGFNALQK